MSKTLDTGVTDVKIHHIISSIRVPQAATNIVSLTTNSPDGLQRLNQLLLLFGRKSRKNRASYDHLHMQTNHSVIYHDDDDNNDFSPTLAAPGQIKDYLFSTPVSSQVT